MWGRTSVEQDSARYAEQPICEENTENAEPNPELETGKCTVLVDAPWIPKQNILAGNGPNLLKYDYHAEIA